MHINEKSRESDAKKQVVTLHARFIDPPKDDEQAHAGLDALITPRASLSARCCTLLVCVKLRIH